MRYIFCFTPLIALSFSCGSAKDKDKGRDPAPVAASVQPATPVPSTPTLIPTPPSSPDPTLTPTPAPPSTSTPGPIPEFGELFTSVLQPKCLRCHNSSSAADEINLETREIILATADLVRCGRAADSLLYQVVEKDEMPFRGLPLAPAEKKLLQLWIDGNCL